MIEITNKYKIFFFLKKIFINFFKGIISNLIIKSNQVNIF